MIKIMPGQIWSEGSSNHNHHFGYWKVLKVVEESEHGTSINMQSVNIEVDGTYHGAFVLAPGQEWTNKCPDCDNSSTQATIAVSCRLCR